MLPFALHGYYTSGHISAWVTPPPSLSIQHKGHASDGGRSPVNRSSDEGQTWLNLNTLLPRVIDSYIKRMKKAFNKEGSSPWIPEKETLYSNIHYLFNQTPGSNRCIITKDGDKLVSHVNADAVKKYFVKIYKKKKQLDKSQTWKGGLGKKKRRGGLKTRKGGPGKN